MADLTDFFRGGEQDFPIEFANRIVEKRNTNGLFFWTGTEDQYDAIALVSDPTDIVNFDNTSDDYDPDFVNTLYYVTE